jgi:hypothetical protein
MKLLEGRLVRAAAAAWPEARPRRIGCRLVKAHVIRVCLT